MKSMTKLIVVAMILAAALVVTPVAARTISTTGANVFVGEENLNFSTIAPSPFIGAVQFVHYSDKAAGATDKTLRVNAEGNITEFTKGIPTGTYYAQAVPGTDLAGATINVQNPEATLDIVLNSSTKDSVNGKSIARGTGLDFKFFSNVDTGATASVDLTLPGGGVVTTYNGRALTFNANGGNMYVTDVVFGQNAEAGTYTAVAKWARATDFFGKGFDSKPVTFEVLTKALSITANKDSIIRGNSFTVTITGESRHDYNLSVKGADPSNPKLSPMIAPSQTALNKSTVFGETNSTITTNAGGTATIQFNTSSTTPMTEKSKSQEFATGGGQSI